MNGDAYGTDEFNCDDCKWSTSFQWDEASDTHYYETRDFRSRVEREEENARRAARGCHEPLDDKLRERFIKLVPRFDKNMIRYMLESEEVEKSEIDSFITEHYP